MSEIDKELAKECYKIVFITTLCVNYPIDLIYMFMAKPIEILIANIIIWLLIHIVWFVICIIIPILENKCGD